MSWVSNVRCRILRWNILKSSSLYCPDRNNLMAEIADADVYMGHLGRDLFVAAQNLKWVQSPSTGVNYYLMIPELVEGDCLLTGARAARTAPASPRASLP